MSEIPPAVRILPMSTREAGFENRTVAEVQDHFFLVNLPITHAGRWRYRRTGLHAEAGAVVLFQFTRRIIASGMLLDCERFPMPDHDGCAGALVFDAASIRVFEPIELAGLRRIWPKVTCLGQAKWSLDPKRYPAFAKARRGVCAPALRS